MSLTFGATLRPRAWPPPGTAPAQAPRDRSGREPQGGPPPSPCRPRAREGRRPTRSPGCPHRRAPQGSDAAGCADPAGAARRAEVREREAAWTAKAHEVEQHLADILADAKRGRQQAEADYQNAQLTREVSEIEVVEYEEGIYVQDYAAVPGRDQARRVGPGDR